MIENSFPGRPNRHRRARCLGKAYLLPFMALRPAHFQTVIQSSLKLSQGLTSIQPLGRVYSACFSDSRWQVGNRYCSANVAKRTIEIDRLH